MQPVATVAVAQERRYWAERQHRATRSFKTPIQRTVFVKETDSAIVLDSEHFNQPANPAVQGKRIALAGRFGGMNRREATNLLQSYGARVVDLESAANTIAETDWIVIGADEPPLAEADLLSEPIRRAAASGQLEILNETELWQRLGLVDHEQAVRRYYTPAMLAHLLGVSIRVIRRWHRRGLITPVRALHNLPYFDFQEVATARRLANWIASGASAQAIEQRLVDLIEVLPTIQRPLDQLSILIEGKHVLLRHGQGLLELGGQLRFDFDSLKNDNEEDKQDLPNGAVLKFPGADANQIQDDLLQAAYDAEDDDDLETAIEFCHAILARDGPRADISFQLGELLYRAGETIAARERYYSAIELDANFVEARASLGAILAETGQLVLAKAAFKGALSLHSDYAEVHFNLARTLDQLGDDGDARHHWGRFLELSPESPWAGDARQRLADPPLRPNSG